MTLPATSPVQTVLQAAARVVEPAATAMLRMTLMSLMALAEDMRTEAADRPDLPAEFYTLIDGAIGMLRALLAQMAARQAAAEVRAAGEVCAAVSAARAEQPRRCMAPRHEVPGAQFAAAALGCCGRARFPVVFAPMGYAAPDTG